MGIEGGVGNLICTGNMSLSIIRVVSVGTAPLVLVPSPVCSTSNRWMTVMTKGVISQFVYSRCNPAHLHN